MSVTALDTRRPVLGGSTIAAAVGIDPYCSPIRLWLQLTTGQEREENEAMRLGKRLEPVIFDALVERGYRVRRTPNAELADTERPWLVGHPDGFDDDYDVVVEAKAAGYPTPSLPPQHEAQVQTYLHLSGLDAALVARLAGLSLTVWEVERNQHAIEVLLALAEAFVGYVRRGEQPAPAGHPDDRAALLAVWPNADSGRQARETRAIRDARRELQLLLEREKTWKARTEHLRAVVTDHMGAAETLLSLHDEPVATWRNVSQRRLDTERLKREHPSLYEAYSTLTTTRRLVLP